MITSTISKISEHQWSNIMGLMYETCSRDVRHNADCLLMTPVGRATGEMAVIRHTVDEELSW